MNLYTPERIAEIRARTVGFATWLEAREEIAAYLGVHPDNVTKAHRRYKLWVPSEGVAHVSTTNTVDGFDVEVASSKAATLQEVITLCKVDTDQYESKGFNVRRSANGFAWSARFGKKTQIVDVESLAQLFADRVSSHAPKEWAKPAKLTKEADCLYVLNIHDLHLAKLAHGDSTGGADWDIRIAEQAFRETVKELIDSAPVGRIEEVVVIIGSDMLQIDTDQSTTTAGTYVDSDSRLSKVFDVAAKMLTDTIEELASRFKVRAVVIAGNHDSTTSHFLGQYVKAWFHTNPNVTVDGSCRPRKYLGYGKTLIAFEHGDGTKLKDLPLVVMRENQESIGQYKYVECLVGHLHQEAAQDIQGIVVRTAPALCSPDLWHSSRGFVGAMRRSQGLLYQRENGLQAIHYSKALD